ncbi:MAG: hypothetical protein JO261_16260 [Alphaproteobacteria bacterium]|nr:hypothetical protein [Alphaproteobacteria bacterium]MBV9695246.1 hypothetical protein [Alphaproteobacteria bacterium]
MRGWGIALLAALIVLPLWLVRQPAMPDYPAHLATYHLIAGGASAFYRVAWAFLPNLAGEVLVPVLAKLFGLEPAARLFMTAALALWVIGPALIQHALTGRVGLGAVLAAFFAYNADFLWGFLNYQFAMGAAFVVFAAWVATDGRRTALHLIGFAAALLAIYFCHLFALAALGLLMAAYEADRLRQLTSRRERGLRLAAFASIFAPAALSFLLLKPPGQPGNGLAFNLADTALDKLGAAVEQSFDNPSYVLVALLAVLLLAGLRYRFAAIDRRMRLPLALLTLAVLFMPEWAMGGWGVHLRLPAVLGALIFASCEFRLEARALQALAAAAIAVLAYNIVALTQDWIVRDRQFSEFRTAIAAHVPQGTPLMTVLDGDAIGFRSDQPYWHMAEFAVVDRGGFTPLLFATPDQHVIRVRPPWSSFAAASAEQGSPPDIDELDDLAHRRADEDEDIQKVFPYLMGFQCVYRVAVVVHLNGPRATVPAMLRLRWRGSFFTLYDIVPDASCKKR